MRRGSPTTLAGWMMAGGVGTFLLGAFLLMIVTLPPKPTITGGWPLSLRALPLAAATVLLLIGPLAFLLGLALYVFAPAFWQRDRALQDYGSHRVVLASTLLAAIGGNLLAALYFAPVALLAPLAVAPAGGTHDVARRLLSPSGIAVAAVSLDVVLLAIVYLRIVRPGAITWGDMGLDLRHLRRRLVLGLLCGLLLFLVSSLLELILAQLGVQQTQSLAFQSVTRASPREFGVLLLAAAVVAPVVEEIYFRGYVFRAYLDQKGRGRAFLFSSALFATVHLNLPALLPIFAMGLLLSFFYYRTGSIVPGIVAHAVNNAAAFTLLYLGLA